MYADGNKASNASSVPPWRHALGPGGFDWLARRGITRRAPWAGASLNVPAGSSRA